MTDTPPTTPKFLQQDAMINAHKAASYLRSLGNTDSKFFFALEHIICGTWAETQEDRRRWTKQAIELLNEYLERMEQGE